MTRMPYLLGATGLALALTTVSCTTLGTHVKGGFACKAPQGTCAPMSNIDAQAIAGLGADGGRAMPIGTSGDGDARFITMGGEGIPVRSGEHVMRIVFPAHTDGSGVYHEEAVAHVVSEHSGWTLRPADAPSLGSLDAAIKAAAPSAAMSSPAAAAASAGPTTSAAPLNLREAAAGLAAPADPIPDAPRDEVAVDMPGTDSGMPTAAALAAARAGHRIGDARSRASGNAGSQHAGLHQRHQITKAVASAPRTFPTTAALNRAVLDRLVAARSAHVAPADVGPPRQVASAVASASAQPAGSHQ